MRHPIPCFWPNLIHGTSLYTLAPLRSRGAGFGAWGSGMDLDDGFHPLPESFRVGRTDLIIEPASDRRFHKRGKNVVGLWPE